MLIWALPAMLLLKALFLHLLGGRKSKRKESGYAFDFENHSY